MALLDRVATLVRANLNDLIDKAENPEKMLKQVILDMENQFMQVKTQVAIALADLHLLEKKKTENAEKHAEWMRKAELAVDKKDDQLARAALERAVSFQLLAENFDRQIATHHSQVDSMKAALKRLEVKLSEARTKADLLIVQHRRPRHRVRPNAFKGLARRSLGRSQRRSSGGGRRRSPPHIGARSKNQRPTR